jgi:hypothetical protein
LTRREVKGLIDGGPDSPCDAMWETSHFYAIKYHELVSTREKPYVHTHMYIYIYIYYKTDYGHATSDCPIIKSIYVLIQ